MSDVFFLKHGVYIVWMLLSSLCQCAVIRIYVQRTSEHCALARKALASRAAHSIVSFRVSCARVATSPIITALVARASTAQSLKMKTSRWSTLELVSVITCNHVCRQRNAWKLRQYTCIMFVYVILYSLGKISYESFLCVLTYLIG